MRIAIISLLFSFLNPQSAAAAAAAARARRASAPFIYIELYKYLYTSTHYFTPFGNHMIINHVLQIGIPNPEFLT